MSRPQIWTISLLMRICIVILCQFLSTFIPNKTVLDLVDGLNRRFCFIFAAKRIKLLAERARSLVPDITSVNFKKKEKKSKKKKVNASFFDIAK